MQVMELSQESEIRLMKAGQAVVEVLKTNGVEVVFGLNGSHILWIYDALVDAPSIQNVTVKHENNAAIAADAYGRLTGKPGIVLVTAGPGALNSISGIAGAFNQGSPVVHISGGVPTTAAREAFHGVDDKDVLLKAFAPVTKWSVRIEHVNDIVPTIQRAFQIALSGKPGPVHVEIAQDIIRSDKVEVGAVTSAPKPSADRVDAQTLIDRIEAAKQIAIVAGKDANWPAVSRAMLALAERLGAPITYVRDAQSAIPSDHPLLAGPIGGNQPAQNHPIADRLVREADLVVGVGVRPGTDFANGLVAMTAGRAANLSPADEPDPAGALPIKTMPSLAATIEAVAAAVTPRKASDALLAELARGHQAVARGYDVEVQKHVGKRPWHIGLAVRSLAARLTPDMVVIHEVSTIRQWAAHRLPVFGPNTHIPPGGWGAMGFCVPGMIAATFACPDKKIIGLAGDCSLLMSVSDFSTLLQLGRDVVLAIHNDAHIGMINQFQKRDFGPDRTYGTFLGNTNYATLAEAVGATGIRVEDPAEIDDAWDRALSAKGPVVLDLVAGTDFPQAPIGRIIAQGS